MFSKLTDEPFFIDFLLELNRIETSGSWTTKANSPGLHNDVKHKHLPHYAWSRMIFCEIPISQWKSFMEFFSLPGEETQDEIPMVRVPKYDEHFNGFPLGFYQAMSVRMLRKYIPKGTTFVDIGAHIGHFSFAMLPYFEEIIAIEPDQTNCSCFLKNVKSPKVKLYNCAMGDSERWVNLENPSTDNSGAWEVKEDKRMDKSVQMITLDNFEFTTLDLIKIDVQGYELQVLKGGVKTFENFSPLILIETIVHDQQDIPLVEHLTELGYEEICRDQKNGLFKRYPE